MDRSRVFAGEMPRQRHNWSHGEPAGGNGNALLNVRKSQNRAERARNGRSKQKGGVNSEAEGGKADVTWWAQLTSVN